MYISPFLGEKLLARADVHPRTPNIECWRHRIDVILMKHNKNHGFEGFQKGDDGLRPASSPLGGALLRAFNYYY